MGDEYAFRAASFVCQCYPAFQLEKTLFQPENFIFHLKASSFQLEDCVFKHETSSFQVEARSFHLEGLCSEREDLRFDVRFCRFFLLFHQCLLIQQLGGARVRR
ncbi:MAG: hypothetical protein WA821_19775 [Anaerolineales bacterium]